MFLPQFIYKQGLHLCIYLCKNLTEITCCTAHFTQRWTLLKFVVFMYAMFFRTCMAYFRLLPTVAQYSSRIFVFSFFPCEKIPFCSFIRQFLSCLLFWARFYLIQCGLCTILSCFRFPKESHSHFYLSAYARHNRTGFLQFID